MGVYGYPTSAGAKIALEETKRYLDTNPGAHDLFFFVIVSHLHFELLDGREVVESCFCGV